MRRQGIPEAPEVVPCNPDDCFMNRDGVLRDVKGSPFAGINFIARLVVAKGGDQLESFCGAIDDINTVVCSDRKGACPRLALAHVTLTAAGGTEQLREYLAAETSCQAPTSPLPIPDTPPSQN